MKKILILLLLITTLIHAASDIDTLRLNLGNVDEVGWVTCRYNDAEFSSEGYTIDPEGAYFTSSAESVGTYPDNVATTAIFGNETLNARVVVGNISAKHARVRMYSNYYTGDGNITPVINGVVLDTINQTNNSEIQEYSVFIPAGELDIRTVYVDNSPFLNFVEIFFTDSVPASQDSLKVLLAGNSFVGRYGGMADPLKAVYEADDTNPDTLFNHFEYIAYDGMNLNTHWANGTQDSIAKYGYDYVVLQGHSESGYSYEQIDTYETYIKLFNDACTAAGAEAILFMPWPKNYELENHRVNDSFYIAKAAELGRKLAPIGEAWKRIQDSITVDFYNPDGLHQNDTSIILNAYILYATIFDKTPVGSTFRSVNGTTITEEMATLFQEVAWDIYQEYNVDTKPTPNPPENITATAVAPTAVRLEWDAPTVTPNYLRGYVVYRDYVAIDTVNALHFRDTIGLDRLTTYRYTVSYLDVYGQEAIPPTVEATTPNANFWTHPDGRVLWLNGENIPLWNWQGDLNDVYWSDNVLAHLDRASKEIKAAGGNSIRYWVHYARTASGFYDAGNTYFDTVNWHYTALLPRQEERLRRIDSVFQANELDVMYTIYPFENWTEKDWVDGEAAEKLAGYGFQSDAEMQELIDSVLVPVVEILKNSPSLMAIDLMNEPDWVNTATEEQLSRFFGKCNRTIHDINPLIATTIGCGSPNGLTKFSNTNLIEANDGDLESGYDLGQCHYYAWMNDPLVVGMPNPITSMWADDYDVPVAIFEIESTGDLNLFDSTTTNVSLNRVGDLMGTGVVDTMVCKAIIDRGFVGRGGWVWTQLDAVPERSWPRDSINLAYINKRIADSTAAPTPPDTTTPPTIPEGVDPNFHIYIVFGQSNIDNQMVDSAGKYVDDDRFQLLQTVDCDGEGYGDWRKAYPPLIRCVGDNMGLTDFFGIEMIENLPDSIRVGVIPVAVGGADIRLFDKDLYTNYLTFDQYYDIKVAAYSNNPYQHIIDLAEIAQESGVIKGFAVHQGEANNGNTSWPQMVAKIYGDMTTDLNLEPSVTPILVGEMLQEGANCCSALMNPVINTIQNYIPNAHVVSSVGFTGRDGAHFDDAGYEGMGRRYAQVMIPLIDSVIDGTLVVPTEAPDSVIINFGGNLVVGAANVNANSSGTINGITATASDFGSTSTTGIAMNGIPDDAAINYNFASGVDRVSYVTLKGFENLVNMQSADVYVYATRGSVTDRNQWIKIGNDSTNVDVGDNVDPVIFEDVAIVGDSVVITITEDNAANILYLSAIKVVFSYGEAVTNCDNVTIEVSATADNATGNVSLSATGGTEPYSVIWDDMGFYNSDLTRSDLSTGPHSYTVRDADLCTSNGSVDINRTTEEQGPVINTNIRSVVIKVNAGSITIVDGVLYVN